MAGRDIIVRALTLIGLLVLVHEVSDFLTYVWLMTLSYLASNLVGFVLTAKSVNLSITAPIRLRWLSGLSLSALLILLVNYFGNLDVALISLVRPIAFVGTYSFSLRLVKVILVVLTSTAIAMMPRMIAAMNGEIRDEFRYRRLLDLSIRTVVFLGAPIAVVVWVCAPDLIIIIGGGRYRGSIEILRVLSPLIVLHAINNAVTFQDLYPRGRFVAIVAAYSIAIVVSILVIIGGHILGIEPEWGHVIAIAAALVLQSVLGRAGIPPYLSNDVVKALICAIAAGLSTMFFAGIIANPIIRIFIDIFSIGVVYFMGAWMLRVGILADIIRRIFRLAMKAKD